MNALQAARNALSEIARRFPTLRMEEQPDDPVELSIKLPVQPGLSHDIWLGFQNENELHFSVGHFWMEWFPCTDKAKAAAFVDAVTGFISGRYRILEHYRGKKCVRAELQMPDGDKWRTISSWARPSLPFPLKKQFREIRNRPV
ncbi:hypothetical protein [Ferrovibrio sp.]|jgi:hypothetical protein|uniref:hypothetical protein n=1 Tax=Ferrovibrio sp. TaxID=1917215 RepID=UPI0035AD9535